MRRTKESWENRHEQQTIRGKHPRRQPCGPGRHQTAVREHRQIRGRLAQPDAYPRLHRAFLCGWRHA